jgi:hypothetical protein
LELGFWLGTFLFLLRGLILTLLLLLLLISSLELVSILEYPLSSTVGLVVFEASFVEHTVGVNPLS